MPPLHNHTSYYSEDYFVGKLNIFVGSLASSTLTAHSITFTQDWKRLVILLLSGTPLLAYYCFPLQYRSKLEVRHRKMPAKTPVHSQEAVCGHNPKPDTHWHITISMRFAMSKPLAVHFSVVRMRRNTVTAIFLNVCKVLTSYRDGINQKLWHAQGQTDSAASVARSSQEQIPMEITHPTV